LQGPEKRAKFDNHKPNHTMRNNQKVYVLAALIVACCSFIQMTKFKKQKRVLPKEIRDHWSFIPAGKAVFSGDTAQVEEFYMATGEVTNAEYRAFLKSIESNADLLKNCLVDSNVWLRGLKYGDIFKKHYYSHPAYSPYPVVGITYEAALAYCQWVEIEIQAQMGSDYDVSCKLPTQHEWLRAARGDRHSFVYTWGGPYIRNAQGCVLCNYCMVGDESVSRGIGQSEVEIHDVNFLGVAGHLNDNADILAPSFAYAPTEFGCMNMNGNAAEILEGGQTVAGGSWRNTGYDVRCESTMPYSGPTEYVGFRPMLRIKLKNPSL
jgi:formylglycine-generating enzyme